MKIIERIRSPLIKFKESPRWESFKLAWYRFRSDPLPLVGLAIVVFSIFTAIFALYVAPYPDQAYLYINYDQQFQPPSIAHPFGTDKYGRDVLTRIFFGFRFSLMMVAVVQTLTYPVGVLLGLTAAYYRDSWIDNTIMRIADVFIAVPPLILALSICSLLTPNIFNAMMAVSLLWWPWSARLTYNKASSVRTEYYVLASELIGADRSHIMFKEILPNCMGAILTKLTLDCGWVILIGATLSFVGLGAQPPTPDLGTMTSQGLTYMPQHWWVSIFPALAIGFLVLGFNLLGDGINKIFSREELKR